MAFLITGSLNGYTTAPILQYRDDSDSWLPLPSGSTVTPTSYSFLHPTINADGAHAVSVRDASKPSVFGTCQPFNVSHAVPAPITISTISDAWNTSSFSVSGSLTGFPGTPTLQFTTDGGAPDDGTPMLRVSTWDPASALFVSLAAGNSKAEYLTARGATDPWGGVLATAACPTGSRVYWEVQLTAGDAFSAAFGISSRVSLQQFPNAKVFAGGCLLLDESHRAVWNNSAWGPIDPGGTGSFTYGVGTFLGFAVDRISGKVWWRNSLDGVWNQTVGDNPATNTGGYNISWAGAGEILPAMFGSYTNGANFPTAFDPVAVINGGSVPFQLQIPSGFDALDGRATPAWQGLPGGATTNRTSFSFTHVPISRAGPHTVSVRDASNTTSVGTSQTFHSYNLHNLNIVLDRPGPEIAAPFTVSGTLYGYAEIPVLQYVNNPSMVVQQQPGGTFPIPDPSTTWSALPNDAVVTKTSFRFTHPSITAAGGFTIVVQDATHSDRTVSPFAFDDLWMNVIAAAVDGAPV